MLRVVLSLFLISMVSTALAARPVAPDSERPRSLVLDAGVVLGADVVNAAGEEIDSAKDLLVNTESGKIHAVILASGSVMPWGSLRWNPNEKRFRFASDSAQPASSDASSRDSEPRHPRKRASAVQSAELDGQCSLFLASKIEKMDLTGTRQDDKGERGQGKLASANGVFVDVGTGYLAFITVSFGGVLGVGADSKVVPWHAVDLARDEKQDYQLRGHFGENRLKRAPNYGDGREQLHNPDYRSTLYSYYGIDKPEYDRGFFEGDGNAVYVTLDSVLGADVKSGSTKEARRDTIAELLVDPKSGKAALVLLESGNTTPFADLKWHEEEDCFVTPRRTEESDDKADLIAASSLVGVDLKSGSEALGSVEDIYIDLASNELAYVTLSVGTTFGFGGDVVAIPWDVVRVSKVAGEAPLASLAFSKKDFDFERAPRLDGKAGADIHNPAFRERVRQFYVVEGK